MIPFHVSRRILYRYLDGEVGLPLRRSIDTHVDRCARCRRRLAEAEALMRSVHTLDDEPRPARDLWPDIARRVGIAESRGAAALVRSTEASAGSAWTRGRIAVAATAVVAALALAATTALQPGGSVDGPEVAAGADGGLAAAAEIERRYRVEVERLGRLVAARSEDLGWDLAASADEDLATLRSAVADVRAALRADGESAALLSELRDGYRRELRFLGRLLEVSGP